VRDTSNEARVPINFRMLRLARELRDFTQSGLARRAEISQARISRMEIGRVEPSEAELERMSLALCLPVAFFLEPGAPSAPPLFRKRAIRSAKRLAAIQARLNIAVLIGERLLDAGIEIDPPQVFPESGLFDPNEPDLAASQLRREWRLPVGRVDDVTTLIEAAGGIVLRVDFGTRDATAAFLPVQKSGRLWFLVNTRETAGDRIRLSLAHELGHAVLHRMLPSIDESETELQAFAFAAALLLPHELFDHAVPFDALTLSDARGLKRAFGVSMQAIIRTAYMRGRISRERYQSLYKQLSARQWRTNEPDALPLEPPELWCEVLRIHRDVHGYTDPELADIARVDERVLGELFPEDFRYRPSLRVVSSASPLLATDAPAG
jgi:Zn-dependent peptidase ImmA (M78 family)/DNA-binding XRE family transcriptional regulator